MTAQERVLALIREERRRQDERWGAGHRPDDLTMLAVLMEEAGEVARALIDDWPAGPNLQAAEAELIQVAAVAVRWLEMLRAEQGGGEN